MQKPFAARKNQGQKLQYGETLMTAQIRSILQDERGIIIRIPIAEILRDGDKSNYSRVIAAAKALCTLPIEHYMTNRDCGDLSGVYPKLHGEWVCAPFLQQARLSSREGVVTVKIATWVGWMLYDLTHGWTSYDFDALTRISKATTMRLYIITNSLQKPYKIPLDNLRGIFGLRRDQYKQPSDLVKRIIEPARKELDTLGLHSYKYEPYKCGTKIVGYEFAPKTKPLPPHTEDMTDRIAAKLVGQYMILTPKAVRTHAELLLMYSATPDCLTHIDTFAPLAKAAANPIGYAIASIKKRVKEICKFSGCTEEVLLQRAKAAIQQAQAGGAQSATDAN